MRNFLQGTCVLLCVAMALHAFGQQRTVSGIVTAKSDNTSLPGVSVLIKGTATGTVTDADGKFQLSLTGTPAILSFSFIGFKTVDVEVGDRTVIDVQMDAEVSQLEEIVITAPLGLERQAKELGYAATSITNKELTQAKAFDVSQSLNGKISGVNITTTNSGVFSNARINIRGIRSLTGNNQPMLVVDGAQVPLAVLSSISPEDIASMTILKSGASAALYGPDAVNGVLVVNTKRGKTNQNPVISITSAYQASSVAFFPKLQHTFGAGAGEGLDQYGNYLYVPFENQLYGPRYDGSDKQIGVTLPDGSFQHGPYSPIHKSDKTKFWNTGATFQNSISLTGSDYFLSIQDFQIKGVMPDDKNRRTTLRFNGDKRIGKFSVGYGLGYTFQNSDVVNENQLQNIFPGAYTGSVMFAVMQVADNVPLLNYKDTNSKWGQFSNYYNEFALSPYWIIHNLRSQAKANNIIANATLGYEITPWLKATARFNATINDTRTDNIQYPLDVSDWAAKNRNSTQYFDAKGSVFNDMAHTSLFNVDYFLNGKKNIGSDFNVTYLVGGNYREINEKDVALAGNNLVVPSLYNVSVRSGDATVPIYGTGFLIPYNNAVNYNYMLQQRRASAYGTVGAGYKGWAFLELTGRNDWDSRLSAANRSYFYPSVSTSVILSDAIAGLKGSLLSYVKIRGAYSQSANVNINPYSLQSTYAQPAGFPFNSTVGFSANQTIPSPNLKPETVLSKELGAEIGLFDGMLDLEATFFDQDCKNQVLTTSIPQTTGYTFGLANAASFNNRGVEIDLGLAPLKVGAGAISLKVNATYNTNKVTATPGNSPVVIGGNLNFIQISRSSPTANNIAVVGGPAFQFQLTDYNRDPATGKVIVNPVTGYPSQSPDLVVKGRSLPLWIAGLTPKYEIGGFSFAMTWDYKTGHQFYSGLGSDMDFSGISARSASYGRQRFVFPNSVYMGGDGQYHDNTNIQVQDGNYGFWTGATTNTAIATNYFANATALRLREVNITYVLPAKWLAGINTIKKISVSLIGRNLLLFVPKSNQWGDPEFNFSSAGNTSGLGSAFQTPAARLYGGSINITL